MKKKEIIKSVIRSNYPLQSNGISMLPLLLDKDYLFFKGVDYSDLSTNDLVLVEIKKQFMVHRLVYKTNNYSITKGDNNLKSDGRVYEHQIIGKVTKIKRGKKELNINYLYSIYLDRYLKDIIKLNRLFAREKLSYIFLTGLPLYVYYNNGRPHSLCTDCDILVTSSNIGKAKQIVQSLGYKQLKKGLFSSKVKQENYQPKLVFCKVINNYNVTISLHQELVFQMTEMGKLNSFYPQKLLQSLQQQVFNSKKMMKVKNEQLPVLSIDYLLLYLALRLFHYNYRGYSNYIFFNQIVKNEALKANIDWNELSKLVKHYSLQNFVYPAFVLLNKYYQTKIPNNFLNLIKPKAKLAYYIVRWVVKTTPIFDNLSRIKAGVWRFAYLFIFSPQPIWRRILVFVKPSVFFAFFWVLYQKVTKR